MASTTEPTTATTTPPADPVEQFHASRPGVLGWLGFVALFTLLVVVDNWSFFKRFFS